ncbi:MAG TPA: valine--tRNA ligase [Hyphomicrobiaceae bacterium]|nr:valine--tRNA ligase [Hyphomicrobiaceae bacterium]
MLEKTYQPADIEARIHAQWTEAQAFKAGRPDRASAPPYAIVIPPPNVTGSLHMGHALNNTLQDILCRFERMRGKDVLWQPGTDHAGIATQLVVERQMMERQEPDRHKIGRPAFIEKVWTWKAESGGTIVNQLKRLGASCDWSRERFTMDEGLSKAVLKVFVDLYNTKGPDGRGLIYKDKRLVNWDPEFQSAISDLEVDMVEVKGNLWHFKYPLTKPVPGYGQDHIVVATTRPETMLGDTAVAVHPKDPRYRPLLEAKATVRLPLVGREIPIIADEYSDPEKGSGAVKITPAHDFNDYKVYERHPEIGLVNIFDARARLNDNVPEAYRGLDRFVARKKVVASLEAQGLIDKIEPTVHAVPHAQRGNAVVEPWLTDQWYVNAAELAKRAIAAVENGDTKIIPKNWEKTYFEWMRNIQPWCISRQIWWGHQIPAWYGPDGRIFVASDEAAAGKLAKAHYKAEVALTRDPDVLDTWFSSALWPFSTLGWPDKTPELARYYPTNALVTGFDIIFFWVARMMMMGLHFMKEVPFRDVYIHALVRDEKGAKMSKTKGNVMDPLVVIDQYGADALRFTLAAMAAQGRDIKLSTSRIEGYRNFATKLWNAARFAEMNECVRQREFRPGEVKETINRWIGGEVERTTAAVTAGIEAYKFNEAATAIYDFTWGTFCDWYLELAKPILTGNDEPAKAETRATIAWALDQVLKLLHPFMPFITEELWTRLVEVGVERRSLLCLSSWPEVQGLTSPQADEEIGWLVKLVSEIRSVRNEMNVPAGARISLVLVGADKTTRARAEHHEETIKRLARLDDISFAKTPPKGSAQIVLGEAIAALPLAGVIDMAAERSRLAREIDKGKAEIAKIDAKLANAGFLAKAPPEVVEENRERRAEFEAALVKLRAALKRVEAAG